MDPKKAKSGLDELRLTKKQQKTEVRDKEGRYLCLSTIF